MEPLSPCRKPECRNRSKFECSETCKELRQYQVYLTQTEDLYATPGIDYADEDRMKVNMPDERMEFLTQS